MKKKASRCFSRCLPSENNGGKNYGYKNSKIIIEMKSRGVNQRNGQVEQVEDWGAFKVFAPSREHHN